MKLTVIAAALAIAASTALAQGYGYGPGMGYGPRMGYGPAWGGANLTQEQSEKVAAIQDEARRKHWDTRDQMRSAMFELRQMEPGSAAYAEQLDKVAGLREQMFKSREEARSRIDAVLQ